MYTMKVTADQWFDTVHVTAELIEHTEDGREPVRTILRRSGLLPTTEDGFPRADQQAFLHEVLLLIRDVTIGHEKPIWM